jgi:hypothetical protein
MSRAEGSTSFVTVVLERRGSPLKYARHDAWKESCARSSSSRAVWRGFRAEEARRAASERQDRQRPDVVR